MNTEQLRKEFEAWLIDKKGYDVRDLDRCSRFNDTYLYREMEYYWTGYQAAAKSRDELIGKLVEALKRINIEIEDAVDRYNGTPLQRLQLVKKISYHALQTLPEDLR